MHRISDLTYPVFLRRGEDEISDNLGICRSMKGIALVREFLIQVLGIDNIPIVGYRNSCFILTH